jgi:hypothetical protein
MRPLMVVMVGVSAEHPFEVAAVEDQQPVQTFGADGSDEALGDRVRLWRPHGRLHDPDALAADDLVERGCIRCRGRGSGSGRPDLRARGRGCVPAGLPAAGRVGRAAGEPDAPARVRDEEEHVVAAKKEAFDGEEITGDDARRLHAQELTPARSRRPRCRLQLCLDEQPAKPVGDTRKPSFFSSPQIRRWPQRGFSRASRSTTSSRTSPESRGRLRRPAGCRHFRRTSA